MPKDGVNLYFSIKDGSSQVLSSIGDKTKALDKETQLLAQSMKALETANKPLLERQKELRMALENQNLAVKDARKEFQKYKDDVTGLNLQLAIEEQDALKDALKQVESQLNSNRKSYNEYQESLRKGALNSGGSGGESAETGLIAQLSKAGLTKTLGDSLAQSAGAGLESALGQPIASAVSSLLSGAATGFALGGPVGAAIGAAAGGISGAATIFSAQDDAKKEYYSGLYDDVNAATEEMISSGSIVAGRREQTRRAFAKRLGGDAAADAYLERVKAMAAGTNYDYDEITGYSKQLLTSYAPDAVFSVLQTLSDATAGLSLSSGDVQVMISGLSRMRTTGKATQEYLNYFSERGVDVYSALGQALGVDKSSIAGLVSKGKIGGEFAAQAILDYMNQEYGGLSEDLMSTFDAMSANLEDIMTNVEAMGGEGYNEMRKAGREAAADAYGGALGDAVGEVNRIAGENKAYLENLSEQFTREALAAVLMGAETTLYGADQKAALDGMQEEYAKAAKLYEETGDRMAAMDMERLKEEAEALATAAFESSDYYQKFMDEQIDQIAAIRDNTASLEAATNELRLANEKSKGTLSGAWSEMTADGGYLDTLVYSLSGGLFGSGAGMHAYGLRRVPYNNYPALLHEGERVLTASEARAQDRAQGQVIQITVSGNTFTGTGEEMADQVAEVIARKLEQAAVAAVPR